LAQDETPKLEASAGYSYVRANVSASVPGVAGTSQGFNVNGGSGSVAFNLNHWLGAVADFGGYHSSPTVTNAAVGTATANATVFSYLFGPRVSWRGHGNWTPFVQALFGGAHGSLSATSGGVTVLPTTTKNVLAFTFGGGLDVKATQHIAIRVIQAEYFYTNFTASAATTGVNVPHQNNVRLSFGVVFRL